MCQLRTAAAALVQAWWLGRVLAARLLEHAAGKIEYQQGQNAKARRSHAKATRKRLRALGVRLGEVPRCKWRESGE